jgi:hypothetical protein
MDVLVIDPDSEVPKDELYAKFCEYCRELSLPISNKDPFFAQLIKAVHFMSTQAQLIVNGRKQRVHCAKGLLVKDKPLWGKQLGEDENGNGSPEAAITPEPIDKNTLDIHIQRLQASDLEHYRNVHWHKLEDYAEDYAAAHDITTEQALELFVGAAVAGVIGQGEDGLYYVLLNQDSLAAKLRVGGAN